MSSQHGIAKLALSGFQVFDSLTEIPLKRLTLIFGPNSAGKSSVEDAISILERIWTQHATEIDWSKLNIDVLRHWRRTGAGANDKAPLMQLNATFLDSVDVNESFCMTTGRPLREERFYQSDSPLVSSFELRTTIVLSELGKARHDVSRRDVFADNLFLFSITLEGEQAINFGHPALSQLTVKVDFEEAAGNAPSLLSYANGVVTLKNHPFPELLNWRFPNFRAVASEMLPFEGESPEEISNYREVLSCIPEIKEFSLFLNLLDAIFSETASFNAKIVSASRHVPSNDELTFLIDAPEGFGIRDSGDESYRLLAKSYVDWHVGQDMESNLNDSVPQPIFMAVNSFLTDHLFAERGYCLGFDYRKISRPAPGGVLDIEGVQGEGWPEESGHLVCVYLIDPQQRRYLFEDVGSGLGYVLPVLCGVCEPSTKIVMLQQPELHLHPALQAVMGDVLIEAAMKRNGQPILAETHSEHLLLRVLKRVRQTHENSNTSPSLRISADDVGVLYFDPRPDGTTSVKRLRISDDGEFMDRWPRGFFAERDKELFDE